MASSTPWRTIPGVPHRVAWSPSQGDWVCQDRTRVTPAVRATIHDHLRRYDNVSSFRRDSSLLTEANRLGQAPPAGATGANAVTRQLEQLDVNDESDSDDEEDASDEEIDDAGRNRTGAPGEQTRGTRYETRTSHNEQATVDDNDRNDEEDDDNEEDYDDDDDDGDEDDGDGEGSTVDPARKVVYSSSVNHAKHGVAAKSRNQSWHATYRFGRVIEIPRQPPPSNATTVSAAAYGSGMRRFVIIQAPQPGSTQFHALPIKTYLSQGVSLQGTIKAHHAIIYTRGRGPSCLSTEQPQRLPDGRLEAGMQAQPIRVTPYDEARPLDTMSRLHYADVQSFDARRIDIRLYGDVHPDSLGTLRVQYHNIQQSFRMSHARLAVLPEAAAQSGAESATGPAASASSGSGVITLDQMRDLWTSLQNHALALGIPLAASTVAQLQQLAANPQLREAWLVRLRATFQRKGGR
ncbi:hypothetical protein LTR78_003314 [Recurvomyces mirabilis]|uniref:DUF6590 domain-containing protein n=1 Tax=Recurvomyces mirabilis TaxID=574656 RepID=A0AAE0WSB9_9PEZI|nr:hypothetical protein LTR78_003314 [Recurvomyces mirabilis]KAK5156869.1 hypothetical protein LTS14_004386 [Recurvomyces mirabilis]